MKNIKKTISVFILMASMLSILFINTSAATQTESTRSYSELTDGFSDYFFGNVVDSNGYGGSAYATYYHAVYHKVLWWGYWSGHAQASTEYQRANGAMGGISVGATVSNYNDGLSAGPNTNSQGNSVGWVGTVSDIDSYYATYLNFSCSGYGMSVSHTQP